MSQLLKLTMSSDIADVDVTLYTLDIKGGEVFLQIEDYFDDEFAEVRLSRGEALQLGSALVNWAGENT